MASGLPDKVERFIHERIDSIEQLETLLLLHRTAAKTWRAEEVSRELRISGDSAAQWLSRLALMGLLSSTDTEHQFNAGAPDAAVVVELARCYAERRVAVITAVFSKPDKLQSFADAFRLKKEQ